MERATKLTPTIFFYTKVSIILLKCCSVSKCKNHTIKCQVPQFKLYSNRFVKKNTNLQTFYSVGAYSLQYWGLFFFSVIGIKLDSQPYKPMANLTRLGLLKLREDFDGTVVKHTLCLFLIVDSPLVPLAAIEVQQWSSRRAIQVQASPTVV